VTSLTRPCQFTIWLITVARDRDSDSERLLYFGRVITVAAIAEDCYILVVLFFITVASDRDSDSERLLYFGRVSFFYFFFRPPNFRRPCVRFSRNFATRRGMC